MKNKYLFYSVKSIETFDNHFVMYEFGYVLCNSNFEILDKDRIIINPNKSYMKLSEYNDLEVTNMFKTGTYNQLAKYPTFKDVYDRIEDLIHESDVVISMYKGFIEEECERYNLPMIEHIAFEFGSLYYEFLKHHHCAALPKKAYPSLISKALDIKEMPERHVGNEFCNVFMLNTDEDSKEYFLCCKHLVNDTNISLEEIIDEAIKDPCNIYGGLY